MIKLTDLTTIPRDEDTIISRKRYDIDHKVSGVAVNKKSGKAYNVEVEMDTKKLTSDSSVRIYCSCHDFKFRWAYALSTQGALLHPGEFQLTPAKVTNPENNMKACKHLHTFMKLEMEQLLKQFSKQSGML